MSRAVSLYVLSQLVIFFNSVTLAEFSLKSEIHMLCTLTPSINFPALSVGFDIFGMHPWIKNMLLNIGASICLVIMLFNCSSTVTPGLLKDFTMSSFLKSSNVSDPGLSSLVK